jgi:hypothetical protein
MIALTIIIFSLYYALIDGQIADNASWDEYKDYFSMFLF